MTKRAEQILTTYNDINTKLINSYKMGLINAMEVSENIKKEYDSFLTTIVVMHKCNLIKYEESCLLTDKIYKSRIEILDTYII